MLVLLKLIFFVSLSEAKDFEWQSGDLIFHTSKSAQARAIMGATGSPYTHVGLIEVAKDGVFVIEAIGQVSRTPVKKWIERGVGHKYSLYRNTYLPVTLHEKIVRSARKKLGISYDIYFTLHNREIYCSELIHRAYLESGASIGLLEKLKDLNLDSPEVRALVAQRWRGHPLCKDAGINFDRCWQRVLEDDIVTPASLARDVSLQRVFTNF